MHLQKVGSKTRKFNAEKPKKCKRQEVVKRYQLIGGYVKRLCGEYFESEIQILRYTGRFDRRNLLLISEMKIMKKDQRNWLYSVQYA